MKGLPICFSEVQVKNDVTDNNNKHFVTAFEGECRNIIELREHLKLCFLIILSLKSRYFSEKYLMEKYGLEPSILGDIYKTRAFFRKILEGEMWSRTKPTILLQIYCPFILYS